MKTLQDKVMKLCGYFDTPAPCVDVIDIDTTNNLKRDTTMTDPKNRKENSRDLFTAHIAEVNETARLILGHLTEAIHHNRTDNDSNYGGYSIEEILPIAYAFRCEVLDKHPTNKPRSLVTCPYDLILAGKLIDKMEIALNLSPALIPNMNLNRWKDQFRDVLSEYRWKV